MLCRVLYDNSSGYGIQIITSGVVDLVYLGNNGYDVERARDSYNNAISTLNNKAMQYNNGVYSSGARCVGSVPNNPYYESTDMYYGYDSDYYMSRYDGTFKNADNNYATDYNQLRTLNIYDAGRDYWFASRVINRIAYVTYATAFDIRCTSDLSGSGWPLCSLKSGGNDTYESAFGLRPVFSLNPTLQVTGGNGSSTAPYSLGV